MDSEERHRIRRLRRNTCAILGAGWLAAGAIYLTAAEPAENPLADQLDNSKIYRRSLELYGGKANLLATDFSRWFDGLWHGQALALTVAVLTALAAALYYFFAYPLPPEE